MQSLYDRTHLDFEKEWWYVNAVLEEPKQQSELGFICSFFRSSTSYDWHGFKVRPKLFVNVALANVEKQNYAFEEFYVPPIPLWTSYKAQSLSVRLGLSGLKRIKDDLVRVWGIGRRFAYHLLLRDTILPFGIGRDGNVSVDSIFDSKVYSIPDMELTGRIWYEGRNRRVRGRAWIDHQWANWDWKLFQGWDWLSAYLGSGHIVTVSRLRDFNDICLYQSGSLIEPKGHVISLDETDFEMVPIFFQKSTVSSIIYPTAWRIMIHKPSTLLEFEVYPILPNQEIRREKGHFRNYWEGYSRLDGHLNGKLVTGRAFLELTGYDRIHN